MHLMKFIKSIKVIEHTLRAQKFGNDSKKRLDLKMALARSIKVNLVCTRHSVHM